MSEKVTGADQSESVPQADKENSAENAPEGEAQRQNYNQENLFSKILKLESKTYFLDVRKNKRGQFLKLTESSKQRPRQTVILSGHVVGMLQRVLDEAVKSNHEPNVENEDGKWSTVSSKRINGQHKRLYLDIMENKYGRSLNIAEVSQTKGKSAVIISERGWFQLQRHLGEIAANFPAFSQQNQRPASKRVAAKKLVLQTKTLYFDLLHSEIGALLKLTEQKKGKRVSVFIPFICFEPLALLLEKVQAQKYDADIDGMEDAEILAEGEGETGKTLMRKALAVQSDDDESQSKVFNLDLRENEHGKFLRITEVLQGRGRTVFLPEEAFEDGKECLNNYIAFEGENQEEE